MKKILSVFYLIARHSFYKIIAVMAVSGIVQYLFFRKELNAIVNTQSTTLTGYLDIERVISLSAINVIFALTVVTILLFLSVTGAAFGSRTNYTVKRLLISEKAFFSIQSVYNFIVLITLLGAEILLTYAFTQQYMSVANESFISNQSVFLAFYRNEFLHSLLPLSDILIWVRNAMQIITFSLAASFFSYKQRRGKRSIAVIFLAVFSIIWNSGNVGGDLTVILTYLICACMIGFIIMYVRKGWGEDNEYAD